MNADRTATSCIPRYEREIPNPRIASAFQSDSSGIVRSSACIQATCVHGESRDTPNALTPASSSSALLSRRSSISSVQVEDQSKR